MNLKDKKGSISIFVLVMLLFMSAFLIILYANNVNKSKTIKEQFNIISQTYAYGGGDEGAYDKAYTDLRNKNKQTMTAYSENSSNLELTKTFEENMSNYRIYGNSVQDTTNGNPSPTNPVEIQSVGDKVNLVDITNATDTSVVNFSEGKITITNAGDNATWLELQPETFNFSFEDGQTYTISCNVDGEFNGVLYAFFGVPMNNAEVIDGKFTKTFTYDANSGSDKDRFYVLQNHTTESINLKLVSDKLILSNIQLEKGSEATEYVPYGKYRIPIMASGKNLFNINDLISSNATKIDENTFEITYYGSQRSFANVKVVPNTQYTISFDIKGKDGASNSSGLALCVSDGKDRIYIESEYRLGILVGFKSDYEHRTITFTSKSEYISLISITTNIKNLQIEKGSTATSYEPYQGQITANIYLNEPLRKVGDYADYIDFKTGKVVRQIKKYTFTGNETFVGGNIETSGWGGTNTVGFYQYVNGYNGGMYFFGNDYQPLISTVISNYFVSREHSYGYDDERMGIVYPISESGYFHFRISRSILQQYGSDNSSTTVNKNALASWLTAMYNEGNPVTVDYVLLKTIEEPVNLSELKTYEDYTNIQVLTEVSPSKIEVEYQGYTLN